MQEHSKTVLHLILPLDIQVVAALPTNSGLDLHGSRQVVAALPGQAYVEHRWRDTQPVKLGAELSQSSVVLALSSHPGFTSVFRSPHPV